MNKFLAVFIFLIFINLSVHSQSKESTGKPIVEIFTDFHLNLNDTSKTTGFALNRAHLGYSYTPEGSFSAILIVNVGTPEDLAFGSVPKRYAYFREASVTYTKDKLSLHFGMVSTRIFDFQQGFWSKRYLGPEYQATYGYGSVADLGVVIDYKFSNIVKADFSLLNGEGYTNIQVDNSLKTALGLTITTPSNVAIRLYGDISRPNGVIQTTGIGFAGIKTSHFSIGGEASYKTSLDYITGHDVWGLSATGSIFLSDKTELFTRYDYMASLKLPDDELQWDYKKDAKNLIGGVQYTFNNNLRIALNYRRTNPYNPGQKTTDAIYLNAHFKF